MAGRAATRAAGGNNGDLAVQLAPEDLGRFLREVKNFDTQLGKSTVRRLKKIGEEGRNAVRQRILTGTSHSNTGLRKGLAAGTKVSVRTSGRSAGVRIVTTGDKLPDGKKGLVRVYNTASFRHPVYGHRDRWVTQRGRPYFDVTLQPMQSKARDEIEQAVLEAARTISGAEVSS